MNMYGPNAGMGDFKTELLRWFPLPLRGRIENGDGLHGLRSARLRRAALHPWLHSFAPLGRGCGVALAVYCPGSLRSPMSSAMLVRDCLRTHFSRPLVMW